MEQRRTDRGVRRVPRRAGRVLLVRAAARSNFPGCGSCPAAAWSTASTRRDAVVREFAEETGLRVAVAGLREVHRRPRRVPVARRAAAPRPDHLRRAVTGGELPCEADGTTDLAAWVEPARLAALAADAVHRRARSGLPGHRRRAGSRPARPTRPARPRPAAAPRPARQRFGGVRPGHRPGRPGAADPDRGGLPGRGQVAPARRRHRLRRAAGGRRCCASSSRRPGRSGG